MPNLVAYDPAFAYEIEIIVEDGIRRMYAEQEDVFYYLTVENDTYPMPAMPEGVEEGVLKGMYRFRKAPKNRRLKAQLLGSGAIVNMAHSRLRRSSTSATASAPTCGASPASSRSTPTAWPPSAGTACTRGASGASPTCTSA